MNEETIMIIGEKKMRADIVLYNGHIYTMDPRQPKAQAVALRGSRIAALGTDEEVRPLLASSGSSVDLAGRTVLPGFIDSHVHFVLFALNLQRIDLTGAASKAEALERVKARAQATPPGDWILGGGWDRNLWEETVCPTKEDLDAVVPRHPVALDSKDVHTMWLNSLALQQAGITSETPDPPGGEIVRDAEGQPTGVLRETAQALFNQLKVRPSPSTYRAAVREGIWQAHRVGVTGFHDCEDETAFITFQELAEAGELECRVLVHLAVENLDAAIQLGLRTGFGNDRLRIGGLKIFVDGSLGSRSACMLEPFTSDPENWGILITDRPTLENLVCRASAAGIASTIHAIGDAANREALDVLEVARRQEFDRRLRHRIEHAQLVNVADISRFAQLDVIASMQPQHTTADIDLVETYWSGERIAGAYAWRKLLNTGARLTFGSDCPVEVMDPLAGIHAAITRRRADGYPGPDGWRSEECLTVEEAVRGFTIGAAYASGEENLKGSLTPGKLADLVVLSRDIFAVPPMEIVETRVEATIFDGQVVYGDVASLD